MDVDAKYLLGIDVSTTGAKALVIDAGGNVIACATEEYPLYTPKPLWSEQNPEDWWQGASARRPAGAGHAGRLGRRRSPASG